MLVKPSNQVEGGSVCPEDDRLPILVLDFEAFSSEELGDADPVYAALCDAVAVVVLVDIDLFWVDSGEDFRDQETVGEIA